MTKTTKNTTQACKFPMTLEEFVMNKLTILYSGIERKAQKAIRHQLRKMGIALSK